MHKLNAHAWRIAHSCMLLGGADHSRGHSGHDGVVRNVLGYDGAGALVTPEIMVALVPMDAARLTRVASTFQSASV